MVDHPKRQQYLRFHLESFVLQQLLWDQNKHEERTKQNLKKEI
jgi:hypothetical protein